MYNSDHTYFRRIYDYTKGTPVEWLDTLTRIRDFGFTEIDVRVPWGAHEKLKGIRDFSRSPGLRLEKFLCIVQKTGLSAAVSIGFVPFPNWTFQLDQRAIIGSSLWDTEDSPLYFVSVPSIHDLELFEGFVHFADEVASILSLYRKPEGPIKNISVDFALYDADLALMENIQYGSAIESRYTDISSLNNLYQTSFKNFSSVAALNGIRLLSDRRPWLAAFDYKFARAYLCAQIRQRFKVASALGPLLSNNEEVVSNTALKSSVLFDPTFLDSIGGGSFRCFPCLPGGYITSPALTAFRLWDEFAGSFTGSFEEMENFDDQKLCLSEERNCSLDWLPSPYRPISELSPVLTLICGPYLCSTSFALLEAHVRNGGTVFLPFGVPKYDENMRYLDWKAGVSLASDEIEGHKLECFELGKGQFYLPKTPVRSVSVIKKITEKLPIALGRSD